MKQRILTLVNYNTLMLPPPRCLRDMDSLSQRLLHERVHIFHTGGVGSGRNTEIVLKVKDRATMSAKCNHSYSSPVTHIANKLRQFLIICLVAS